jgi:hypothetical protein
MHLIWADKLVHPFGRGSDLRIHGGDVHPHMVETYRDVAADRALA